MLPRLDTACVRADSVSSIESSETTSGREASLSPSSQTVDKDFPDDSAWQTFMLLCVQVEKEIRGMRTVVMV